MTPPHQLAWLGALLGADGGGDAVATGSGVAVATGSAGAVASRVAVAAPKAAGCGDGPPLAYATGSSCTIAGATALVAAEREQALDDVARDAFGGGAWAEARVGADARAPFLSCLVPRL